jgi:hypothetical protein
MSGRHALSSDASSPRLLVQDGDGAHDVFDVLAVSATVIRVRSPFLFEVGEQLRVRLEHDGSASERVARVRAHLGPADAPVTELEIDEIDEPAGPAQPAESDTLASE